MKNRLKRIYTGPLYPLILCLAYISIMGVVIYIADYFPKAEITVLLEKWVPWNLKINFFLIIAAILVCFRDLPGRAGKFMDRRGVLILILFLVGFSCASFLVPRTHRIFYDEDIYANMGQNMALADRTGYCNYGTFEYGEYSPHWISYNKDPSGWPFLISRVFQIIGTNELYAFFLNNFLFSAGMLTVFFITWHLTGIFFTSLLAALAFVLIPHNLIWANTAAAEPSACLFSGLTVLLTIIYINKRHSRHLLLGALLLPFACQMRPESMLILIWVMLTFLILSPGSLADRRLWTFGLLTMIFLMPHILHFYAMSGHSWGAEGRKFSLDFFLNNISPNSLYYLDNHNFPLLLSSMAVIGLFFSQHSIRWKMMIFCWFLLLWGIFLFFYAGSYNYGADVRFALLSFMPLAVLAGMGGGVVWEKAGRINEGYRSSVSFLIILVMLFSFMKFLPQVRTVGQEAWGARYDHKYAKEFIEKIPERSIILTHTPTMFLLWNRNAIQTYAGINNPELIKQLLKKYQGHVYFHYNYWCNTKSRKNLRLCSAIAERYDLEEIASAYEQDYEYGLYRMRLKTCVNNLEEEKTISSR